MPTSIKTLPRHARFNYDLILIVSTNSDVPPTSPDVTPTRADFPLQYQPERVFSLQYQNSTKEIIIMPSLYVSRRQVGISRGSVSIARSQVGTDRYNIGI